MQLAHRVFKASPVPRACREPLGRLALMESRELRVRSGRLERRVHEVKPETRDCKAQRAQRESGELLVLSALMVHRARLEILAWQVPKARRAQKEPKAHRAFKAIAENRVPPEPRARQALAA